MTLWHAMAFLGLNISCGILSLSFSLVWSKRISIFFQVWSRSPADINSQVCHSDLPLLTPWWSLERTGGQIAHDGSHFEKQDVQILWNGRSYVACWDFVTWSHSHIDDCKKEENLYWQAAGNSHQSQQSKWTWRYLFTLFDLDCTMQTWNERIFTENSDPPSISIADDRRVDMRWCWLDLQVNFPPNIFDTVLQWWSLFTLLNGVTRPEI